MEQNIQDNQWEVNKCRCGRNLQHNKKAVPKTFDKVDGIEAFGVTPVSVRIE